MHNPRLLLVFFGLLRNYKHVYNILAKQLVKYNIYKVIIVTTSVTCSQKDGHCRFHNTSLPAVKNDIVKIFHNKRVDIYYDDSTTDPIRRIANIPNVLQEINSSPNVLALRSDTYFTNRTSFNSPPPPGFVLPNLEDICLFDLNLLSGSYHTYNLSITPAFLDRDWDYGFLACQNKGVRAFIKMLSSNATCSTFASCPSTPPPKYEFYRTEKNWNCYHWDCDRFSKIYPYTFGSLTSKHIYLTKREYDRYRFNSIASY